MKYCFNDDDTVSVPVNIIVHWLTNLSQNVIFYMQRYKGPKFKTSKIINIVFATLTYRVIANEYHDVIMSLKKLLPRASQLFSAVLLINYTELTDSSFTFCITCRYMWSWWRQVVLTQLKIHAVLFRRTPGYNALNNK